MQLQVILFLWKAQCLVIPAICMHLDIIAEAVESDTSGSDDDDESGEDQEIVDHSGIHLKSTRWLKLAH